MMVIQLGEQLQAGFAKIAADVDLSAPLARTVLYLDEPKRMREIATGLGCDPSFITFVSTQLEEQKLIHIGPAPKDKRVKIITLTPKGEQKRTQILESMQRFESRYAAITAEERHTLDNILAKLLEKQ